MRHPFGSICRVTDDWTTANKNPMPTMDVRSAKKVSAQGLLHCGRLPRDFVSGVFSMSFDCVLPFVARIKPKGEDGAVRSGAGGFSIVPFPFRESGGRQLALLDGRPIENERRRSALRRRSSLLAGCADEVESFVVKREELTRGASAGEASSLSDDPDECLLIPAGAMAEDSSLGGWHGGCSWFRRRARSNQGRELWAAWRQNALHGPFQTDFWRLASYGVGGSVRPICVLMTEVKLSTPRTVPRAKRKNKPRWGTASFWGSGARCGIRKVAGAAACYWPSLACE
jgi:hypothetical protein